MSSLPVKIYSEDYTMKLPVAVVTSDCHLQVYNWAKHPDLRGDSFYSFKQIVDYTLEQGLPLILAGDILDKRSPDAETLGFLFDQLKRLVDVKLWVCYIQGQHEMSRSRPWLSCIPGTRSLHKEKWNVKGIEFYGLDFTPADKIHAELKGIPQDADVLVAHQVWLEHMGKHCVPDAAFADVPYVKCIITGDFHVHKITEHNGKDGQRLKVVSPGSTYMKTLDEDFHKYFWLMFDDLTFHSIPIQTRPVFKSRIGTVEALEDEIVNLATRLNNLATDHPLGKPIWCVEYYDSIPNAAVRLEEVAKNCAHLFLRPVKGNKDYIEKDLGEISQPMIETGLETYLPRCVDPEAPTFSTALRLLRSNDLKSELRQIVTEAIQ
jgi:hypothetical protein